MTEFEIKRFHVNSIAQYKVLKHIAAEFIPEGIASLELIENGLKLTDCTGDTADFIYDGLSVIIEERKEAQNEA